MVPEASDRNRTAAETANGPTAHPNPLVDDLSEGAAVDKEAWPGEDQRHDKQEFYEGGAWWKKQEFRLGAQSRQAESEKGLPLFYYLFLFFGGWNVCLNGSSWFFQMF